MAAADGATILEAVRQAPDAPPELIPAPCGGQGHCGRCRVKLLSGQVADPTPVETELLSPAELLAGYRLACQAQPLSDLTIQVPQALLTGLRALQVDGLEQEVTLEPAVRRYRVDLDGRHLEQDWRGVCAGVAELAGHADCCQLDLDLARRTEAPLPAGAWVAAVHGNQVVDLIPASDPSPALGLAVDLGTTKVAAYLMDLESGALLASAGEPNPQLPYGEDVISRLTQARQSPEEGQRLAKLIARGLNRLASQLCAEVGAKPERILDAVVAGNTAMHHLALGLPVSQLARSPYAPAVHQGMTLKARELGLELAPGAMVHFPPNVGGFVGGDHVAMVVASGLDHAAGPALGLDIGTNTEIVLAHQGQLWCASAPSGPAFEGGRVSCGLRAGQGAVTVCRLDQGGEVCRLDTVGDAPPVGFCGSGLLDLAAELVRAGALDERGLFREEHPRVRVNAEGMTEYLLLPAARTGHGRDLVITQRDLGELQLAKAAVAAGVALLLAEADLEPATLREVVVAGAFGTHLDLGQAMAIGMLPRLPLDRYRQVGNAAGTGARLMLVSLAQRLRAREMARRARHLELTGRADFSRVFAQSLAWGDSHA